ncbi:MAG: PrpR N-terminal domain-containing protein [Suipraeoptans sp.]
MSKIAVFLPRQFMLEQAESVIKEDGYNIDIVKVVTTLNAVSEARAAVESGVSIVVARGGQATYIKEHMSVPLVEIKLTGQELGLLIKKAKSLVSKKTPLIAIIGFKNMYSDTTYYDELYDIKLKKYFIDTMEEADGAIKQAVEDGADAILGGDVTCELANKYNIPSVFFDSTKESIRIALETATKMQYAVENEKNHIAQFETVLDTSANGIIKINKECIVTNVNRTLEDLARITSVDYKNRKLVELLPELNMEKISLILSGNRDIYTTSSKINRTNIMVTVVPIIADTQIKGAILNCYKVTTKEGKEVEKYKEKHMLGYYAKQHFSGFKRLSNEMKETIERAKIFALSSMPILLIAEEGTEKERLAQAIHNGSSFKGGPFTMINCGSIANENQEDVVFGENGLLSKSNYGTILINEIDRLSNESQNKLYRTISEDNNYEIRIIVSTQFNLKALVKSGMFRKDLFFLLNSLVINIPPLGKRPSDIEKYINENKKSFTDKYTRYIKISEEAMKLLKEYIWPGNLIQLEAFLERLFLTTPSKTIQGVFVKELLDELYPNTEVIDDEEKVVVYKHPEAKKIDDLLVKHNGNKGRVAKELGISTTTLWRHIKKYNI